MVFLRARHPETFVRREQRALHFVHGGRDLTCQPASGPGDLLFNDRGLTGQLAQVFGSIEAIGWERGLDMAVRSNAFVWSVAGFAAFELVDVLADQVAFDPVAGDEGQAALNRGIFFRVAIPAAF